MPAAVVSVVGLSNQRDISPTSKTMATIIEMPWRVQKANRLLPALQAFRCESHRKNLLRRRTKTTKTMENRSFFPFSALTPPA
jgi:hypothetical protein